MDRFRILLKKTPPEKHLKQEWVKNYRIYEWQGMAVFKEDFPRANKEHICEKCRAVIRKGHFYKITTFKLSVTKACKDYRSSKVCLPCAAELQSQNQLY